MPRARRIVIFELDVTGHRAGYVEQLIRFWLEQGFPGHLFFVVSPQFGRIHPGVVALAADSTRVSFVFTSDAEAGDPGLRGGRSAVGRTLQAFRDWRVLTRYAQRLRADHCVMLFADRLLQSAIALGFPAPCAISGIFFRPMFHYERLSGRKGLRGRLGAWRQRRLLELALGRAYLHTVFTLDPYVLEDAGPLIGRKMAHLADPVRIPQGRRDRANGSNPDTRRKRFLVFGELSPRKGIDRILDAVEHLDPEACAQVALSLVGPIAPAYGDIVTQRVAGIMQSRDVSIQVRNSFVADADVQPFFEEADVILACYQGHVGMSAILVRAAAAGRPVIASDFGAMGETARRNHLGLVVNAGSPDAIAAAITSILREPWPPECDAAAMAAFAARNAPEAFARTIFQRVTQDDD